MNNRIRRQSLKNTFLVLWLSSLLVFWLFPASAQQTFQWRSFTRIRDGLSSNNVRSITEDRFGQIWLATSSGLSRFDGFWRVIDVSIGDSTRNDVFELIYDADGFIWAMTSAGVYKGMPHIGGIDWVHHYTVNDGLVDNRISTAVERENGEIWIGTPSGVNWFDGNMWRTAPNAEEGSVNKGVRVVYEDGTGNLWFGLSRSRPYLLSRYDGVEWEVFRVEDGLPNGDVQAITADSMDNIWVCTSEGVAIYDGSTWQVLTTPDLIGNNVQSIKIDSEGTVWIGTTTGISLFNRGSWRHLTKAHGLASNNIQTLFESQNGGFWVGTRDNGVSFSDRSWRSITTHDGLSDNRVTAMLTDRSGTAWVGTLNGLVRYADSKIESIEELRGREIRVLAQDAQNRLWVGTDSSIAVINPSGGAPSIWQSFRRGDGLNDDSIHSIVIGSTGDVWAGTGILLADETGFLPGLDRYDGVQWHPEKDIFGKINKIIVVMFSDTRERLYFGTVGNPTTESELWVYEGATLNRISVNLNGSINTIMESTDGNIWIGTSDGILILDGERLQQSVRLTTDDGLVDNRVQAFYLDEHNRIWIGTVDGVSLFQNKRFVRSITAIDGLNSNNISAITSVITESGDVSLWFGSKDTGGISRFNQEMTPPTTRIIEGPTNGEIVGGTGIGFKFEGGDLSTPTRELRYQYQLDDGDVMPTDDEGHGNRVVLSSLAEGRHRFAVWAIDREGNPDPLGAQAEFVIDSKPPTVRIVDPKRDAVIAGIYTIVGTAIDDDFFNYQVRISSQSAFTSSQPVDENTLYTWDTHSVPDGTYRIQLLARDTPNGKFDLQHRAEEIVTVEVDNTVPRARIAAPLPGTTIHGETEVEIELTDVHLMRYWVEFTRVESTPDTPETITSGSIADSPSSIMKQIPWDTSTVYGPVMLRAGVVDAAGNEGLSESVPIYLNNEGAKPVVEIHRPDEFSPIAGEVTITGTVTVGSAPNTLIENFHLEYRHLDDLHNWMPLRSGRFTLNSEEVTRWDTASLPDGKYLLRLTARDSNGYSSIIDQTVTLDNAPPTGIIESPENEEVLKASSIYVIGTAIDEHFKSFELEYSGSGETWIPISRSTTSVQSGRLGTWNAANLAGGTYRLRITAVDLAGLETAAEISVVLDNADVIVQISSPEQDEFVSDIVRVMGTANDENFDRYHLDVRLANQNGEWQRIPGEFVFSPDQPKDNEPLGDWYTPESDGRYQVRLTAFDRSGKTRSHIVEMNVDNLKPSARISKVQSRRAESPDLAILSGEVEIIGEANDVHFKDFRLDYRPTDNSDDWQPIPALNTTRPRRDTTLAIWRNTPQIDGEYEIRLIVEDKSGKPNDDMMRVIIDNQSPDVEISQPTNRQLVSDTIEIIGTAKDNNLEAYQLDFRAEDTAEWQQIIRATHPKQAAVLGEWEPPMVDGGYEIRLLAFDKLERPNDAVVQVIVDRLPPQAEILSPTTNQQLPRKIEIRGTADDRNFDGYIIEYGEAPSPEIWRPISKTGFLQPVNDGLLAEWNVLDLSSGEYTLRLRVKDDAGHQSVDYVKVIFRERVERQNNSTVESEDGIAKIVFPPNSLPEPTYVTINPVPSANGSSSSPETEMFRDGGLSNTIPRFDIIYSFEPENLQLHRLKPATIEFAIQGYSAITRNEALTISRWEGDRWKPIGGTVNPRQGTISTVVSGLGQFAVTLEPAVEEDGVVVISELICQPRLFSPNHDESTAISFRLNRPSNVTVRIYNEAGRLRRTLRESEQLATGRHVFWWDGRDNDMRRVVSNFYIVTVKAEGVLERKVVIVQNN